VRSKGQKYKEGPFNQKEQPDKCRSLYNFPSNQSTIMQPIWLTNQSVTVEILVCLKHRCFQWCQ